MSTQLANLESMLDNVVSMLLEACMYFYYSLLVSVVINFRRCVQYFINNNYYLYLPDTGACCLAMPNLGPTPPNWLAATSKYIGQQQYVRILTNCLSLYEKFFVIFFIVYF